MHSCHLVRARTRTTVFNLLHAQGLKFADLAVRTGLNVRTLHNVASGTSPSRSARRKIENALGVQIWTEGEGDTAK